MVFCHGGRTDIAAGVRVGEESEGLLAVAWEGSIRWSKSHVVR
uniref:Uncharacterized protein n=1 Tax=Arundo donax TaxID=35708 RepID=A0A0A9FEE8_ARUDO